MRRNSDRKRRRKTASNVGSKLRLWQRRLASEGSLVDESCQEIEEIAKRYHLCLVFAFGILEGGTYGFSFIAAGGLTPQSAADKSFRFGSGCITLS